MAASAASLYVGDLDPNISETQLSNFFSIVGPVDSVRVCRDMISGSSLRYAYVNFFSHSDASNALKSLNYTVLNGTPIRIMWSHRDPLPRKTGIGNLFIKNLDLSISNARLNEIFHKFGHILSCKVAVEDGKSKGYGFVQFDSEEAANNAIETVNGTVIEGKEVYVGKFIKKSQRGMTGSFTNLYMNNLDRDLIDEVLRDKFSEFGKINSLTVMKDGQGKSRGFGFVSFFSPDDAQRALEATNGVKLGSKTLYVGKAQKKAEREQILQKQFDERRKEQLVKFQASNVYVKNIDDAVSDNQLREHFSVYGEIVSAKVMLNDKGISRGFGFVCFSIPEEAKKAVAELHGTMFSGKRLYVAMAQRKEERHIELKLQNIDLQLQNTERMVAKLTLSPATAVPANYTPIYCSPPRSHQAIVFPQNLGPRPEWRPGFSPTKQGYQLISSQILSKQRQQMQTWDRINMLAHPSVPQTIPSMPHLQQPVHLTECSKDRADKRHCL